MSWHNNCCCGGGGGGTPVQSQLSCNTVNRSFTHSDGAGTTTTIEIYTTSVIWAEESAQLSAPPAGNEWSWGDSSGGTTGLPVWEDMQILGMISHFENGSGTATVELMIDGVSSGQGILMTGGINPDVDYFFTPINVTQGQLLGLHTANVSGPPANQISNARVGIILRQKAQLVCSTNT